MAVSRGRFKFVTVPALMCSCTAGAQGLMENLSELSRSRIDRTWTGKGCRQMVDVT